MSIYGSAVKKPITTIMIFAAVIVFGLFSLTKLPVDLFPEIEYPAIMVFTSYVGANASDIETNISEPLENALNSVNKLKDISSISKENISIIVLEFEFGTDLDAAANDIRDILSVYSSRLPENAENPTLFKFSSTMMPIMFCAITADESYQGLEKELEKNLVNPLKRIDGIGTISLVGTPKREVAVNIDPLKMEAYNLTIEQIGNVIKSENLDMPLGNVEMGKINYPLRVQGEFETSDEIKNIVIGNYQGKTIYLKDVAVVNDSLRKMTVDEKINGETGIRMMVMKQSGANTVQVARQINEQIPKLLKNLPPDVKIMTIMDSSDFIKLSINNLSETLLYAFIFVILVVIFFLGRWRTTFIIVLTIPISLVVAFIYLGISKNTINIISLSALSIAIGMVVDDAIVVLENITKHIERGSTAKESSIYGTNEVWLAVIASTLTIIAVFFPLTMVSGLTGIIFKQLGWIVTITILTSAVSALTLTPMLSSKLLAINYNKRKTGRFSHEKSVVPILNKMDDIYVKAINWSLSHKRVVVFSALGIFIITLLLATTLKTEFIPEIDSGQLTASIELQSGIRVDETKKTARKIESFINENIPERKTVSFSSGIDEDAGLMNSIQNTGTNIINITMRLVNISDRERSSTDIADALRKYIATLPEVSTYTVSTGGGMARGMGNNTVDIEIYGYDFDQTNAIANNLAERIKKIQGARDVVISRKKSNPELHVILDKEKMSYNGLNTAVVSSILRNRVYGYIPSQYRESGNEYDIRVRFDEEYRNSITDVENIAIPTVSGFVRLGDIAKVVEKWSPPNIDHKKRERMVKVSVTPYKVAVGDLAEKIQSEVDQIKKPSGILIQVGGAYEDLVESFSDLGLLLIISLILVYIVMASQFESLKMPLIIMTSVPFAFSGVILALLITRTNLSIIAAIGAVMLIGIAVKNAIVLIDFINLMRDRGYNMDEAIKISGRSRLRPVLMTTMTTILGMLPLALSTGEGAEIWKPMGIAIIGGLIFSTVVTLIIIPVVYKIIVRRIENRKIEKETQNLLQANNDI